MMKTTPRRPYQRFFAWMTAATLAFALTACGGSDDESDQNPSSQPSANASNGDETNSDSTGSEGGAGLPDGFPDGVPLPEYNEIKSGGQLSETSWRLLLVVDPDDDSAAENYAAALTDAGFEVDTSDVMVSGNSPTLSIDGVCCTDR